MTSCDSMPEGPPTVQLDSIIEEDQSHGNIFLGYYLEPKPSTYPGSQDNLQPSVNEEPASKKARLGFSCEVCDVCFTEKRTLQRHCRTNQHRKRVGLPSSESYPCTDCSKSFSRDHDRVRHETEIHRGIKRQSAQRTQSSVSQETENQAGQEEANHVSNEETLPTATASAMAWTASAIESYHESHEESGTDCGAQQTTSHERERATGSAVDSAIDIGIPGRQSIQGFTSASLDLTNQELSGPNSDDERYGPRNRHMSVVQRHGRTRLLTFRPRLFCAFCEVPFEHILEDLMCHLRRHLDALKGSHLCEHCHAEFVHQQDLVMHRRAAAKGNCGFTFRHKTPCTGHHSPEADDPSAGLSDWDGFRLCMQLRDWEQSQLRAYMQSISDLVSVRQQDSNDADSHSIEVLYNKSRESLAGFAISLKTLGSAPGDELTTDTGLDARGLRGRLRIMSLRNSGFRQGGFKLVKDWAKDSPGVCPVDARALYNLAGTESVEEIKMARKSGLAIDKPLKGCSTVLCYATSENNLPAVKTLLYCGANANMRCETHDAILGGAATHATQPLIDLLINHGADINLGSPCQTPLCRALRQERCGIIWLLLRNGAKLSTCQCSLEMGEKVVQYVLLDQWLRWSFLRALIRDFAEFTMSNVSPRVLDLFVRLLKALRRASDKFEKMGFTATGGIKKEQLGHSIAT